MSRKQPLLAVLLAYLIGPSAVQSYELISASQNPAPSYASGNRLAFGASFSDHAVWLERMSGPNPRVDYLRISGATLDHNGGEFWSLAQHGEFYDSKSEIGRTIVPWKNPSTDPPGIPIVGDTFYLAWTQVYYDYFPPIGPDTYAYGWVKLQLANPLRSQSPSNASPNLILLGGGYSYGGSGIVVGVPEPAGATLGATSFLAILVVQRRRRISASATQTRPLERRQLS